MRCKNITTHERLRTTDAKQLNMAGTDQTRNQNEFPGKVKTVLES